VTAAAVLLASLDVITAETTTMLSTLYDVSPSSDRHEAKRRVLEIRGLAQETLSGAEQFGGPHAQHARALR
jgi:hypothetical protein